MLCDKIGGMRLIIASALAASIIVGPSVVFAQGATVDTRATVQVQAGASTTPTRPMVPPLGPAIRQVASTTRDALLNTASTTREAVQARVGAIQELIAGHKQALAERKATLQLRVEAAKVKARAKFNESIQASVEALVDKLTAATTRLDTVADKLEGHIGRLEAEGKDMSQSAALLADARAKITIATEAAATASATLDAALGASTPKAEMPKVRAAVQEAQTAIREAHAALKAVFPSIRVEAAASASANTSVTQ